jgi:hypothetical protein
LRTLDRPDRVETRTPEAAIMTVSQENEIQWEPQDPHEAMADTLASFRVDGLEIDELGSRLLQRVADGEIDHDQAVAIALQHYRA